MTFQLNIQGNGDVDQQLRKIASGVAAMMQTTVQVGSRLPYAYGQETGTHRVSGKLARRYGPTYYLRTGMEAVLNQGDLDITQGLAKIPYPGPWIMIRLGRWIRRIAKQMAPVGDHPTSNTRPKATPGQLRRSLRIIVGGAGAAGGAGSNIR